MHRNIAGQKPKLSSSKAHLHDRGLSPGHYSGITDGSQLVAAVIVLSHAYHSSLVAATMRNLLSRKQGACYVLSKPKLLDRPSAFGSGLKLNFHSNHDLHASNDSSSSRSNQTRDNHHRIAQKSTTTISIPASQVVESAVGFCYLWPCSATPASYGPSRRCFGTDGPVAGNHLRHASTPNLMIMKLTWQHIAFTLRAATTTTHTISSVHVLITTVAVKRTITDFCATGMRMLVHFCFPFEVANHTQ